METCTLIDGLLPIITGCPRW